MDVTASQLLQKLPPYQDQWILVKEDQQVKDIKRQIEIAHTRYADYYDTIALYFDGDTIHQICKNIDKFIRRNIEYREEPKEMQTTSLVTGILFRGFGDCKHYALMTAGILNSIQKLTGKKIDWSYVFASYTANPTPHHVFVSVYDEEGNEIWIDPVPGSEKLTPVWMQRKNVKSKVMPLMENIAGIGCGCTDSKDELNNKIGFVLSDITAAIDIVKNLFGHKPPTPQQMAAALQDVRQNYYPGPNACVTGNELLPVYVSPGVMNYNTPCGSRCNYIKTSIEGMMRNVQEEHIPNNDIKYLTAYKTVIAEYQAAYQQYCGGGTTTMPSNGGYLPASQNNSGNNSGYNPSSNDLLSAKNALPVAGAVGLGSYLLFGGKGRKKNFLIPLAAAGITYFMLSNKGEDKRAALVNWTNSITTDSNSSKQTFISAVQRMSADEVNSTYDYIFNFFLKNQQVPTGTSLYNDMTAISSKYNIFT